MKTFAEIYGKPLREMKGRIERKEFEDGTVSTDYSPEWEESDVSEYIADLQKALPMIDPEKVASVAMNSYDDHWGFGVEDVERDFVDILEEMGIEYQGDNAGDVYEDLNNVTSKWWNKGEDVEYDDEEYED